MEKVGIVICSRVESKRLPQKPLIRFAGLPVIEHLISRLVPTGIDIVLAVPYSDLHHYDFLSKYNIKFFVGSALNPLDRMYNAAFASNFDTVIRITHDKIFVDTKQLTKQIEFFINQKADYLYSSDFIAGTGFEIISFDCLARANKEFANKDVEHISYAAKLVSNKTIRVKATNRAPTLRLLLDYPKDKQLFETVFEYLHPICCLDDVIKLHEKEKWLSGINQLPKATIYTCAYNAEKYLTTCINSVVGLVGFRDFEYLLVDDGSTDNTSRIIAKYAAMYNNIQWIKNPVNIGLASSSNVALSNARAPYIIRIDADDFFTSKFSVFEQIHEIKTQYKDAIYPDNYFGDYYTIQQGNAQHHIGGTIFNTSAINFIKFTDGLKGFEGYDFFIRAKDRLNIGYINKPLFFYTQRNDSMSHINLEERQTLKDKLHGSNKQ